MTRVRLYTDEGFYTELFFLDSHKAERFADDVMGNDGLEGVAEVVTDAVPTDDEAVNVFWSTLAEELDDEV